MSRVKISKEKKPKKSKLKSRDETFKLTKKCIAVEKSRNKRNKKRLIRRVASSISEASENNKFQAMIITWCKKCIVQQVVLELVRLGYQCSFSEDVDNMVIQISWCESDASCFSERLSPFPSERRLSSPRISPRDSPLTPRPGSQIRKSSPREKGNKELYRACRNSMNLSELRLVSL